MLEYKTVPWFRMTALGNVPKAVSALIANKRRTPVVTAKGHRKGRRRVVLVRATLFRVHLVADSLNGADAIVVNTHGRMNQVALPNKRKKAKMKVAAG
jgi:hypothetical protein